MDRIHRPKAQRLRRRGRVLGVKFGYNPNSSSLGLDVTLLLFGSALASLMIAVVSAIIRLRARSRTLEAERSKGKEEEE